MSNQPGVIDLGKLFQSVAETLAANRDSLNKADTGNHDHGDNMVNTFQLITRAISEKKGANQAEQLGYAAAILGGQKSGSAQLYAQGLSQASQQFQGQEVTADNALALLQTLLNGGGPQAEQASNLMISPLPGASVVGNSIKFEWKASPGANKYWLVVRRSKDGSDRIKKDLGNVLSSDEYGFANDSTQYKWTVGIGDDPDLNNASAYWTFTNGPIPPAPPQQQSVQQPQNEGINDIIGSLIRKAQGPNARPQQPTEGIGDIIGQTIRKAQGDKPQPKPGEGVGDLIGQLIRGAQQKPQAQKQAADSGITLDSIVKAVVSNSAMGGSYREQSGSLVANGLISAVQNMVNKK
jgi:hypothetical protein